MKKVSDFAKVQLRMAAHVTSIVEVEDHVDGEQPVKLTLFHLYVDRSDQTGGPQQSMTVSLETDFVDTLTTVEVNDLIRHEVVKRMFNRVNDDA